MSLTIEVAVVSDGCAEPYDSGVKVTARSNTAFSGPDLSVLEPSNATPQ